MIDQKTLVGWTGAALDIEKRRKAAIHPSGHDLIQYNKSGKDDAERVLKYAKPGDVLMDYGCGDGRVLMHIENHKVVGIDAVPEMAALVGGSTPEKFFDKVDLIYCISVFIHNQHATGAEIIKWMTSRLNEGGLLLLQLPLYDEAKQPADWIDVGVWTPEMLRQVARANGLKILETHTNNGSFSFSHVGPNHYKFQVLQKVKP
jgi:cyclopropane fatty-acyl-phospholipid synthase-like methyltransferase